MDNKVGTFAFEEQAYALVSTEARKHREAEFRILRKQRRFLTRSESLGTKRVFV
jgi:hypothetical protein